MPEPTALIDRPPNAAAAAFLRQSARKTRLILALSGLTLLLAVIAINAGAAQTHPWQVLRALLGLDSGASSVVIWNIRLPRVIAGLVAGVGLAVAGCVMQTCLRNPLASPSTLGISNAAAFGANLAILYFGAGAIHSNTHDAVFISNPYSVTLFAFIFSVLAMMLILLLARMRGFSPESVVLAGVAFGSLFAAASTLVQYFAEDVQVAAMVFWTFGDLGRVSWQEAAILSAVVATALIYFLLQRWNYNALESGEDAAKGLGVHVEQVRFRSLLAASLITATAVAFMGIIGFIGLIAPQMMRRILGIDHRCQVYAQLPYNFYNTNIDTAIADAYYLGKALYPAAFADVDPVQKADAIYTALVGKPVYAQLAAALGGFGQLKLSGQ